MNCSIPGANLKVFGKALQALCRFGDELSIEPTDNKLSIRTVNMTKTAYAVVDFPASFFMFYQAKADCLDDLKCKLPLKSMLNAFKNTANLEKNVSNCNIEYAANADVLILKFRFKYDIVKTHIIYLLETELVEDINFDCTFVNTICASGSMFQHALQNFQMADFEISFDVNPNKLTIRNYVENELCTNSMRSQLTIYSSDFYKFEICQTVDIRFSLKLFRAAIAFVDAFRMNVELSFSNSGVPLVITVKKESVFEAKFVLATLRFDCDSESLLQNASRQLNVSTSETKTAATKRKLNTRDPIETEENWLELSQAILNDDGFPEEMEQNENPAKRRPTEQIDSTPNGNDEVVETVFRRCFEQTINPFKSQDVLVEDSDVEDFD